MLRRAFVIAALLGALAAPAFALAAGANLLKVLAGPIASAKEHGLKVLVPSTINPHAAHVYGSGTATAKGYGIQLGDAPNCGDADACFVADFLGNPGKVTLKPHVALAHGIIGGYHPVSCGASCAPATIEWKEFGMLYTIQDAGGTKAGMAALANSAISAGPR
jgi:hypothetical protein